MELKLKEIINLMKEIKLTDINDEYEVFFSKGRPIIQLKLVEIYAPEIMGITEK